MDKVIHVERLRGQRWVKCKNTDLKPGDIYRRLSKTGFPPGNAVFASSPPACLQAVAKS